MIFNCIIIGYPGSQKIVPASKYLATKYLPNDWNLLYVCYEKHVSYWAAFVKECISEIKDQYIIFSLDDYLISAPLDIDKFNTAFYKIGGDIKCVKLCHSTIQEHEEYPVTTQWTIWDREYLIEILETVTDPWSFEIHGSKIFDKICLHAPCLEYFTNSSISSRWDGVRLDGLKEDDINELKRLGYV